MIVPIILCIFLATPFIVIHLFRKLPVAKNVGTVIMAYAVGIVLALIFTSSDLFSDSELVSLNKYQDLLTSISVIIGIPLMLFNSDFRLWTKSLPKTFIALFCGVFGVTLAIVIGFFLFKNSGIQALDKVSAMMVGIYTGGTMNFAALGKALEVNESIITLTLTLEMLIVFPIIIFFTAGGYKLLRKLLPFKNPSASLDSETDGKEQLSDVEQYNGFFAKKSIPKTLLGLLLSIVFVGIGAGLSLLITGKLNELVIILTITTLAIIASFYKPIRTLPKTFELGMFFILLFSVVVASKFDISAINAGVLNLLWFIMFITFSAVFIHLLLCRIFKVTGDLFTVALVAMLCSPPFVPPIVSAMGNRKVLISGITIGLVGYTIGTYLGVVLAYTLGFFV